ncbi:hypothetical protein FE697_019750 [Mumia zhuanghuii]|uniref:Uncharacterized protein n=2 Tax=Mumia TaxID=1546255 RepID=A0ABW1QQV0_9ACTN|nr:MULTISPECIES: hypothetical protein [Mumia]KAA1420112.1 hypothetical protein FE697_019750 [Mumia zhuanghuii]
MSDIDRTITAVGVRRSEGGRLPSPGHVLVVADVSVSSRGQGVVIGSLPAVFVASDGSEHRALPVDASSATAVLEPYTTRPVRVLFDVPRKVALSGQVRFAASLPRTIAG